jgi:hypothetical protein
MNQMSYCACGFASVKFQDGNIIMVKYEHDTVKPGDCIGTYKKDGSDYDLVIYFGKKTFTMKCRMDNLGLLRPPGLLTGYQAINDESYKLFIYKILKIIHLA